MDGRTIRVWWALWLAACGGEVVDAASVIASASGGMASPGSVGGTATGKNLEGGAPATGGVASGGQSVGGTPATGGMALGGQSGGAPAAGGTAATDASVDAAVEDANLPDCSGFAWYEPCQPGGACASSYTKVSGVDVESCTEHGRCYGTGSWERVTNCRSDARCPEEKPAAGSPCGDAGLRCAYSYYEEWCAACGDACVSSLAVPCANGCCCDSTGCGWTWFCDVDGSWKLEYGWGCIT